MSFWEVETILRNVAGDVKAVCPGNWSFFLANGRPLEVTAHAGGGWMQLCAVPDMRLGESDPWDLLQRNSGLGWLFKYVLPPRTAQVHLRAEFLLDGHKRLKGCLEAACRGFLAGGDMERRPTSGVESDNEGSLAELCAEAGWPCSEKDEHNGRVDLETGYDFYQALVERRDRGVHAWVQLARAEDLGKDSRRALAILLLRSTGAIRLARAATRKDREEVVVGLEVVLARQPSVDDLNHAFSALSVACCTCGREARELRDPGLATSYLRLHQEYAIEKSASRESTAPASKED
jgi:hypothetical protein